MYAGRFSPAFLFLNYLFFSIVSVSPCIVQIYSQQEQIQISFAASFFEGIIEGRKHYEKENPYNYCSTYVIGCFMCLRDRYRNHLRKSGGGRNIKYIVQYLRQHGSNYRWHNPCNLRWKFLREYSGSSSSFCEFKD